MKKLLLAAGLLFFGLSGTFAQELRQSATPQTASRLDPKRMAAIRTNRLEKELSLTAEQKSKVQDIFSQISADPQNRHTAEKEAEQKIKAILTPEQAKKYDDMMAKREEMRKEKMDAVQAK